MTKEMCMEINFNSNWDASVNLFHLHSFSIFYLPNKYNPKYFYYSYSKALTQKTKRLRVLSG